MTSQGSSKNKHLTQDRIYNDYKDVLVDLQQETILIRKLHCVEILISKYIPAISQADLESEILYCLMPCIKDLQQNIFDECVQVVLENSDETCLQALTTIKEHFQMAINLLQTLADILDFILDKNKINFSHVQSVPLNVSQILYTTFLHCKESNNIYKIYFDSLNEVLILFKKAQEVHCKFLKVLDSNLVFNFLFEDELSMIKEVLDNLLEVGEVLTGMNIKSMTDNWKTFIGLTQKYGNVLSKDFEIQRPISFLTLEIINNIKNVFNVDPSDTKSITQTLKVSGFLVKVFLKFCDMFWENLRLYHNILWNFFIELYNFSPSYLNLKKCPQNIVDLFKSHLFVGFEQFLNKLSFDETFFQSSNYESKILVEDNVFGFILTSNIILNKLLLNGSEEFVCKINFSCFLKYLFAAINKSFTCAMSDKLFYNELIMSLTGVSLLLDEKQFLDVEMILCKMTLGQELLSCLTAIDVWCLIISNSCPSYGYETLCNLIDRCHNVLKANFTRRPEFTIFYNFIRQLYKMQSNEFKIKFIEKYPLESHIYVWKHIGLQYFPNARKVKIDDLLSSLLEKMEKYDSGKFTFDEFVFMCDAIYALSTVNFTMVYFNVDTLTQMLIKLWCFDATDGVLLENDNFKFYLQSISKLTSNLLWNLSNTQLVQILQQMKSLTNGNYVKLLILEFLNLLKNKCILNTNEQPMIFSLISELFHNFLTDNNLIVKQQALQVFTIFLRNTPHDVIIHNSLKTKNLQDMVSNFVQKIVPDANFDDYFSYLKDKKFRHRCQQSINCLPTFKKIKLENTDATIVLQRIRKDVEYFKQVIKDDNLTRENVSDIKFIVQQLNSLV